jgi:hypothetical protein
LARFVIRVKIGLPCGQQHTQNIKEKIIKKELQKIKLGFELVPKIFT